MEGRFKGNPQTAMQLHSSLAAFLLLLILILESGLVETYHSNQHHWGFYFKTLNILGLVGQMIAHNTFPRCNYHLIEFMNMQ